MILAMVLMAAIVADFGEDMPPVPEFDKGDTVRVEEWHSWMWDDQTAQGVIMDYPVRRRWADENVWIYTVKFSWAPEPLEFVEKRLELVKRKKGSTRWRQSSKSGMKSG